MTWRYAAASVLGASHRTRRLPCQDANGISVWNEGCEDAVLVIAVSDGAGGSPRAEVGSRLACETVIAEACRWLADGGRAGHLDRATIQSWIEAVSGKLGAQAAAENRAAAEFACTLLLAVIGPEAAGYAQIGDGAIVVRDGDRYRRICRPDSKWDGIPCFLTDKEALEGLTVEHRMGVDSEAALFTDGLEPLLLREGGRTVHEEMVRALLGRLRKESAGRSEPVTRELANLLAGEKIERRTQDDKTLALAMRN
jgi:hypothetical protein